MTHFAKKIVPMIQRWELPIDGAFTGQPQWNNLNNLQEAAYFGDVGWLEAAIAIGAAIDFPVLGSNSDGPCPPTPENCTALLIAMSNAVSFQRVIMSDPWADRPVLLSAAQNAIRCAIILVMQGANVNCRLEMPTISGPVDPSTPCVRWQLVGVMSMSVKDMAASIEDQELLEAIKLMEEASIEHAWCRCGSRLRWTECHAAPAVPGQHPHGAEAVMPDGSSRLLYRLSPLAPCPSKVPGKTYFDCCGWMASHPGFLCDTYGKFVPKMSTTTAKTPQALISRTLRDAMAVRPTKPASFEGTEADYKAREISLLRLTGVRSLQSTLGPTCILDWETTVYTGVLERLDNFFYWTDLHYMIEEAEILKRVEEWNDALEVYCDDMGLVGAERERIIRKHTASPFAPCANPVCHKYETSVKQYNRCSKCKTISYCSRECQKEHWKKHKPECDT